jgi:hypothetical protein
MRSLWCKIMARAHSRALARFVMTVRAFLGLVKTDAETPARISRFGHDEENRSGIVGA